MFGEKESNSASFRPLIFAQCFKRRLLCLHNVRTDVSALRLRAGQTMHSLFTLSAEVSLQQEAVLRITIS